MVVWKAASNGEFSVRTASLLATVGRKDGVPVWQDHLEVSCAGETQVLYVPCSMQRLPNCNNLQRRGWHLALVYHLYSNDGETCQLIL